MPRSLRSSLLSCLALATLVGGCDSEPGGGGPEPGDGGPEVCSPVDDSNRVDLAVDLGGFVPEGSSPDGYRFDDLPCTVSTVDASVSGRVRTELDCETAAGPQALEIGHAASDLGEPAWAAGDALLLSIDLRVYSDLNENQLFAVALRSPEGEPRLLVQDTDIITESIAAPIALSLEANACPDEQSPEQSRGRLTLGLDGAEVQVLDGNDGTLETSTGTWAVELEQAVSGDFGERSLFFELLVMKVQ